MLSVIHVKDNILELTVSGTIETADFIKLAAEVDRLVASHGNVRLLVNASGFVGWDSIPAAQEHFAFVQGHHQHVEKLALVTDHLWQHWLAGMMKMFLHPEMRVFNSREKKAAEAWLQAK